MNNPFLRRARFGFWLAWLPMTALVVVLLNTESRSMGWAGALVVAIPLSFLFALVCRSSWYMCKTLPPRRTGLPRLVSTLVAAAAVSSGLWVGLAYLISWLLPGHWMEGLRAGVPMLFGLGALYFLLSVAYHYVLLAMEDSRRNEQRAASARTLAREAELKALRAQVNPHFLFNSLNSIAALTGSAPERARQMCLDLSGYLRSTMALGERSDIRLGQELDLLREYLAVERVRFGDRLQVRERIEEACLDHAVPALLLQPLVENAIKHGVGSLPDGGWVEITADCEGERLCIGVTNPYDPDGPRLAGIGRGSRLVRERVEARFGGEADLRQIRDGSVWRIEIRLPIREVENQG